jgi:hypothetical protein
VFQNFSKFPAHDPVVVRHQDSNWFHYRCYVTGIGA